MQNISIQLNVCSVGNDWYLKFKCQMFLIGTLHLDVTWACFVLIKEFLKFKQQWKTLSKHEKPLTKNPLGAICSRALPSSFGLQSGRRRALRGSVKIPRIIWLPLFLPLNIRTQRAFFFAHSNFYWLRTISAAATAALFRLPPLRFSISALNFSVFILTVVNVIICFPEE
jgi:hypothetical protein